MEVNLINETFNHVTIDFKGNKFILNDGEDFSDNQDLIDAFPQYFTKLTFKQKVFNSVKSSMKFIMSQHFITMIAMLMIATSAIFFDIDGWAEVYHRISFYSVLFMITSLYVAKMAIIKILSTERVSGVIGHYVLRSILIMSLVGMVIVSSTGIYSSLAVNTVGDAKTISRFSGKIGFIDDKVKRVDEKITDLQSQVSGIENNAKQQILILEESVQNIKEKIKQTKKVISELPKNYITKRRNMTLGINKMNNEIFAVQSKKNDVLLKKSSDITENNENIKIARAEKDKILSQKEDSLDTLEEKTSDETNKALNYTAELLGVSLLDLLKFINLLMTFVLEITYLSLTWHFVRLNTKQ